MSVAVSPARVAPGLAALNANAEAPPPRKRRRRTAGGGARDDCFTCEKRAVKCDRKRPYCTQCIDIGKECSGYKTTLTWGVGVASRGKLRGLSCPIANKNPDGSNVSVAEDNGGRRRKSSLSFVKKEEGVGNGLAEGSTAMSMPMVPEHTQPVDTPTLPMPVPQERTGWQIPGFHEHMQTRQYDDTGNSSLNLPPLHQLQTGFGSQYSHAGMPGSAMSIGSYAETEYHSPMEYPQTPGSMHFGEPTSNPFIEQPMTSSSMDSYAMQTTLQDSFPDMAGAMQLPQFTDATTISPLEAQLNPMSDVLFSNDQLDVFALQGQDNVDDEAEHNLALFDSRFSNPFFHLTPRLQSLMEYYDRYICPFLVAFDGTQNPYRRHVLQLAVHNEGLQNAIAALSTNNLRMRKKQPQQIRFVEELTDAFDGTDLSDANEASAEETMYKQISIDQLNMQLTDIRAAQDDSVLATLLILCLFHVCDSGFSKFKTQLAGVQKLLSLRNPNVPSEFTGWVEMFFTWFDVMTSTVNDREMQIKGDSLDMLDFSANLGALEQFSGCDGRLFKIIACLGRLNLLAQGRPVRRGSASRRTPRASVPRPTSRFGRKKTPTAKFLAGRSLSPSDYENMDGNGWGTPILSSDEDADGSMDEDTMQDDRKEFWKEWKEVRCRLQAWQMDSNATPTSSPNAPTDPAQLEASSRDLVHINESFRFSALLYTERLGNPVLPSSNPQFQQLVSQALAHISALSVTSCVNKFLLWPLFITGTECVDEVHRNIVRSRCIEIQRESGFFNNLSGLEVLEKVWSEVGSNVAGTGSEGEEVKARRRDSEAGGGWMRDRRGSGIGGRVRHGQAFRWRKAMDRVDGEYIVI
ncbi:hypothetical protein LTR86_007227 [Recurvomyces mirabilis]|nr:hypothetical protein LTR86_007227 [Recurvomyces mirabilis]